MPIQKITLRPGVNTMSTQTANEGGWSLSNLIRFRQGFLEKIGGWTQLFSNVLAGTVRALFAYEDLASNKNLLIGGDGGLQAYVVPSGAGGSAQLINMRLASQVDSVLYAAPTVGTLSGTSGSNVITVTDPNSTAVATGQVAIPIPISIGGIIIQPQTVTVATAGVGTWTFNAATNLTSNANTSGNFGTVPVFSVTAAEQNTVNVRVVFPNHGLVNGNTFTVQFPVVWQAYTPTTSLPAGTYTVTKIDNNTFTVATTITQTALGNGAEQGFDPAQSVGTIHGVLDLVYFRSGSLASPTGHWYLDNFGGQLIIGLGGGPMFNFVPPVSLTGTPAVAVQIANAPLINTGVLVAMPQAQIVAFGSETVIGSGVQDPLMIRWSDAGNINTWTASSTNQAGSFRLSKGSAIVGAIQAPQTTLIWTDVDCWAMTYIQPPLVYSINIVGSECGLIGPKARCILGRNTYWMSPKGFFVFGDSGLQQVECPIWDSIFTNINPQPLNSRVFAGTNTPFGEVIWFYPSIASGNGECDSYIKFKPQESLWDYGTLSRSAWLGVNIFGMPLASDFTPQVQQHETTFDSNGTAMSGVFAETGYFDVSQGDYIPFIDQIIPDIKWFGSGGSLNITLWAVNYPFDTPVMYGPYTVTPSTQLMPVRVRKRQVAMRIDWAATAGFTARVGAFRARISPAGRRP
jgi:hypothetical protein